MPIIVDEVVISVQVTNQASGGAATPHTPPCHNHAHVAECVERVLEVLRQKREA